MKKVLLHICCGICAGWAIEKLIQDGYVVVGFFYNPNIHPPEEYSKRLEVAQEVARHYQIELIEGIYNSDRWQALIATLENEPEGGRRCEVCFRMRLAAAAVQAADLKVDFITTTLTISPHKDAVLINKIGKCIAPQGFLEYNFRKEDGFKKANTFAREHNLYRQHYCGCRYSMQAP
jgi:epoxyqueuosine reductase